MEIQHQKHENKGKFFIEHDGKEVASMHYVYTGDKKIIIDHTEVATEYEGRGLGKQLVTAGVAYARKNDIKIIPLCPFAKGVFDRVPAFGDVLE